MIFLYNTATKKREEFVPLESKKLAWKELGVF